MKNLKRKHFLTELFFLIIGVGSATIGLRAFLLPNEFLDGGAMGVSLLMQILTPLDLSVWIILVNIPFLLIGARQFSLVFAIKSAIAIVTLAVLVHFVHFPAITDDKLLIAVFGGFFLGCGIGFSIRGGAVIDGTEVIAVLVNRKTSLTVGDFIAVFNVVLFTFATLLINIETAMYSMLTYLAASKTIDFIINGFEEYLGVMIMSKDFIKIKDTLRYKLRRSVTVFKSGDEYRETVGINDKNLPVSEKEILFCVVTRLEVTRLINEVEEIDEKAFVIQYPIKDTRGGMIKRRPMH
jgi:uncharacterized membrane-anchored protein YitT (DUF2179 family)